MAASMPDKAGREGGTKLQCFSHFAPSLTHCLSKSISRAVKPAPADNGGMRMPFFSVEIRSMR